MQYHKQPHLVAIRARYLADRALVVSTLTDHDADPIHIEYERRELLNEYRELQDAMRDAGLID